MASRLTESLEDYLEAIAELIAIDGHAHSKEIAQKLHVKMPSVTSALRQLEKMGYIIYRIHYPVQLTPAGKAIADDVIHRHTVLTQFFSGILGLPTAKASETACHLEHVVDADTIQRFVLFSEAIENRCDAKNLQKYLTEAVAMIGSEDCSGFQLLPKFGRGELVRIVKIGGNLDGMVIPGKLKVGDAVSVEGMTLDREKFRLNLNDSLIELPLTVAENIWGIPVK